MSLFVCVRFLECSVYIELCINLTLRLLTNETYTNGDEWKGHRVIGTQALDRLCMFSPDRRRELINGFYPRSSGQPHSLE